MASSFSTNLRLELQATGENNTTWGTKANNVFDMIEDAISGFVMLDMNDANLTLTTANGTVDQARCMFIRLNGAMTAQRDVIIPAVSKMYIFYNNTSGGFPIRIKHPTGVGQGFVYPQEWSLVWADGVNGNIFSSASLNKSYAQSSQLADLSGVTNAATARTNLGLGTMATQNAASVAITGGTVSGITDLAIADGGTGASSAAAARTNLGLGTMATQNSNNLAVSGGTMAGVAISGGSISGITDLSIADGGTGSSTAAGARTNLGLGTMATQSAAGVAITGGTATLGYINIPSDYINCYGLKANHPNPVIASSSVGGSINFYPNGVASSAGVCSMNSAGMFYAPGGLSTDGQVIGGNGSFRGSAGFAILGTYNASGDAGYIYLRPRGYNSTVGQAYVDYNGLLSVYGSIYANGNITAYSDQRLKEDIAPITDALAKVETLNGITYRRNDKEGDQRFTGLIAQEVQSVLPEAVEEDDKGYLTLAYGNLVGLLVEAIKELRAEVNALKEAK